MHCFKTKKIYIRQRVFNCGFLQWLEQTKFEAFIYLKYGTLSLGDWSLAFRDRVVSGLEVSGITHTLDMAPYPRRMMNAVAQP